jgi:hypothetical protein
LASILQLSLYLVTDGDDYVDDETEEAYEPLPSRYAVLTCTKPRKLRDPPEDASLSDVVVEEVESEKDTDEGYIPSNCVSTRPSVIKNCATLTSLQGQESKIIDAKDSELGQTFMESSLPQLEVDTATGFPATDFPVSEESDAQYSSDQEILHAEVMNPDGSVENRVFIVDHSTAEVLCILILYI